jgi:hypothetical protein
MVIKLWDVQRDRLLSKELRLVKEYIVAAFSGALSAGFVFAEDGTRVTEVTYAFMALLFAVGLSSPASLVQPGERPLVSWRHGAAARPSP